MIHVIDVVTGLRYNGQIEANAQNFALAYSRRDILQATSLAAGDDLNVHRFAVRWVNGGKK